MANGAQKFFRYTSKKIFGEQEENAAYVERWVLENPAGLGTPRAGRDRLPGYPVYCGLCAR